MMVTQQWPDGPYVPGDPDKPKRKKRKLAAERDAMKRCADICRGWSASIDTGKKRTRVIAAAMQGALSCAALIDAEIERIEHARRVNADA